MCISLGHIDEYYGRVATFAQQFGRPSIQLHCPHAIGYLPGVFNALDP